MLLEMHGGSQMLKAVLFDLDDTLLANSMDAFVVAYFQALTRYVAHLVPPERLIAELLRATRAMEANDGSGPTNEEAFAAAFFPALGYEPAQLRPVFDRFYAEEFPKLKRLTRRLPEARRVVEWAFEQGYQVAIATNPMFPRSPVEQRLGWAGVPATEFAYALVTTYEDMHATKAHPAYYREILARLGREPEECLMVGDDWKRDIALAASVGIPGYWVTAPRSPSSPAGLLGVDNSPPGPLSLEGEPTATPPLEEGVRGAGLVGQGTLAALWEWFKRMDSERVARL